MMLNLPRPLRQTGSMLLEGLIAILIFSVGILAIVGMQAAAIKASSDAKYRSEAGLLANEIIGRMWVSDRTQATLQTAFSSPGGTAYQAWAWGGSASTSGTQTAPASGTVLGTLPGSQGNPPTVAIVSITTTTPPSSQVTITVFWQAPGDTTAHRYTTIAQIGG